MTDTEIIGLYLARSQEAISETSKQYKSYCTTIAMSILHNQEDADECVNDVLLSVWNAIPPQTPTLFSAFIGRITRNISLDRHRKKSAQKRGGNETILLLSELELCIPSAKNTEDEADINSLAQTIDEFLSELRQDDRAYFMCRYWYAHSVLQIASKFNVGDSKVKMSLHRTRKKLKAYFEKRGITV